MILLHRPFADGNTSWKFVQFDPVPGVTTLKFKKYDLFCTIPEEGVSDIPNHVQWLALAVSPKRIWSFENTKLLNFYEGADSLGTELMGRFNNKKFVVPMTNILIEAFRMSLGWNPKRPTNIKETIRLLGQWLQDGKTAEMASKYVEMDKRVGRQHFDQACINALVGPLDIDQAVNGMQAALDDLTWAWGAYAGHVDDRKMIDRQFGNLVREYLPLPVYLDYLRERK